LETLRCRESIKALTSAVGKYRVRLVPFHAPGGNDVACRAYLLNPAGNRVFLLQDWDVSV
jgi:hypothetical protein